jgi:hypothetical protein
MHNEEFHKLFSSPKYHWEGQVKENEVGGACGTHGRGQKSVQGFGRKPEGKGPLVRPRRRWENVIRMDLRKIGWGCGVDSTGSGQGPVAG